MRDIINRLKQIEESQTEPSGPQVGDEFGLSFSDDLEISTTITDVLEDGIVVEMDDDAIAHLTENGAHLYDGEITETEAQKGLDGKRCWKGYRRQGTKMKGGKRVDNCVKVGEGIEEDDEGKDRDSVRPEMVKKVAEKIKAEYVDELKTYNERYQEVVQQLKSSGITDPKEIEQEIDDMDDDILGYYFPGDIKGKIEVMDSVLELGPDADGHDIVDLVHNSGMDTSPREEIADQFQNELKKADPETFKKLYGNETTISDINDEGVEEAGLAGDPENRDGLKPWLRLSQLMDQEITKISFKSDEGIELANALEAVTNMIQSNDKLLAALTKTGEPKEGSKVVRQLVDLVKGQLNKGESIPVKADSEDMIKFINDTIVKFNSGAEFDRTKIKDPNPEPEMEKESSELDRIRQLSGIQTEGHGPEVDSFLEKVAADPDNEGWDMLYDAASGKHGDKIYKAVMDMYNDVSVDNGYHPDDDFEKIYDRMLDHIIDDYGPKESFRESQISELSPELLNRYKDAAYTDAARGMAKKRMGTMSTKDAYDNEKKRYAGIDQATFLLKMKALKAKKKTTDRVQGQMKDDLQYDESVRKLADAVLKEGASDSVNMAKLKKAVGGEEALVDTLYSSAVQNQMTDGDFLDAARRMLNISEKEIQAIIDKNFNGEEPEKTKYSLDDLKDMRDKLSSRTKESLTSEAEYQGRKVSLGKPTRGDVKKFKVYVKNPKGNVVKVNFGDPNMKIKKSNPARRKSFRARHNCDNPGPRHKARYWSCRKW